MKLLRPAIVMLILVPFIIGIGCSDKSSNSSVDMPADLVGTWWFTSATMNDVPVTDITEISHSGQAASMSITFNTDATYSGTEYDDSQIPVFTQSGEVSEVDGNSLTIRRTEYNGTPVSPPQEFPSTYAVAGSQLTMTETAVVGSETLTLVTVFTKGVIATRLN